MAIIGGSNGNKNVVRSGNNVPYLRTFFSSPKAAGAPTSDNADQQQNLNLLNPSATVRTVASSGPDQGRGDGYNGSVSPSLPKTSQGSSFTSGSNPLSSNVSDGLKSVGDSISGVKNFVDQNVFGYQSAQALPVENYARSAALSLLPGGSLLSAGANLYTESKARERLGIGPLKGFGNNLGAAFNTDHGSLGRRAEAVHGTLAEQFADARSRNEADPLSNPTLNPNSPNFNPGAFGPIDDEFDRPSDPENRPGPEDYLKTSKLGQVMTGKVDTVEAKKAREVAERAEWWRARARYYAGGSNGRAAMGNQVTSQQAGGDGYGPTSGGSHGTGGHGDSSGHGNSRF